VASLGLGSLRTGMPIFLNVKLPSHSDGSESHPSIRHEGARRRKLKGQIFFLVSLCSVSMGLALWRHFPTVRQPIGESSASVSMKSADDPRLEVRLIISLINHHPP
jgi:hypothetical protein